MITDRRPTGLCSQHEPVGLYLAIAATSHRNIFDPTIIVFFYDLVVLIDHNDIDICKKACLSESEPLTKSHALNCKILKL